MVSRGEISEKTSRTYILASNMIPHLFKLVLCIQNLRRKKNVE
jgi:hypothetical protein